MECHRCEQVVNMEDPELSTDTTQILPGIEGILCPTCGLCVGLYYVQEWIPVKQCLLDPAQEDGWTLTECQEVMYKNRLALSYHFDNAYDEEAEGLWDKAVHWTLSQVVYRTMEPPNTDCKETLFDIPDPTDVIYLLWVGGKAVGFCTLKPRGALYEKTVESYAMMTIDTIFVRSSYRRRGHVRALLEALSESHDDLGFSQPISDSMVKVLSRFLVDSKVHRRRFWEISGAGNEGCRKLLWYTIRHKFMVRSPTQDLVRRSIISAKKI